MNYTFYFDYEDDDIPYEEFTNSSTELQITYSIQKGRIMIQEVKMNKFGESQKDILLILDVINHDKLTQLAKSDQMRRDVKQQYKNYPELANMMQTPEQWAELQKIK